MDSRRFLLATLLAWMAFIAIDFFFHAGLFRPLWNEDVAAYRSTRELATLIPVAYAGFLVLTLFFGYVFGRTFRERPSPREAMQHAVLFAGLLSLSGFLGMVSYLVIPVRHLVLFHIAYFIELVLVGWVWFQAFRADRLRRLASTVLLACIVLVFAGVVLQNMLEG